METFSASLAFVREIHRPPVNSPHKGQWRAGLMFLLICAWIYGCANNRESGDLRRHRVHYDVIVMLNRYSPSLATEGLSVGHETWSPDPFVIRWSKCIGSGVPQSQCRLSSFGWWEFPPFFKRHWPSPVQYLRQANDCHKGCARRLWLPSITAVWIVNMG